MKVQHGQELEDSTSPARHAYNKKDDLISC